MGRRRRVQGDLFEGGPPSFEDTPLAEETQRRYLNYALSVITSRALPDVRDGLKPVQRRILYAMFHELHLRSDAKYRKCALIVGEVMGKYHPHGDTAIYDALARMAQDFVMQAPLVDGRGNFGSPDGDAPAAMRYTEARLERLSSELLVELGKKTVAYRPNYDGTRFEPVVLPARFPNLLVNGSQGIAVGMATAIPPHNLGEVVKAAVTLIDEPQADLARVMRHLRGPDFPTGGQLLSSRRELEEVYATGHGTLKLRGTWVSEGKKRSGHHLVITSIPYGIERRAVVEAIAQVIIGRKLPFLLDVRDESTSDCRVVLEIKRDADPQLVMAYLFKHTPLQSNVHVNLTCLVPTQNPEIAAPQRLTLLEMLRHFLDFRMEVVTRRLEFDLDALRRRIHILEGFITIFDALDETIRIIRKSQGKSDAAQKLRKRFGLDDEQVDAILELKLYRLAQLEIQILREELAAKRKEARRIERLLKSEPARWKLIRDELTELGSAFATERRTTLEAPREEVAYDPEAFIVEEDAVVLLTRQGWIKRQGGVKDLSATRIREGDRLLGAVAGSTRASLALFSNLGTCFVCRLVDIPPTTGYGSPVQALFRLADGERIIRMLSLDPRVLEVPPQEEDVAEPEPPYAVAVTRKGMTLRFSLRGHREPSTRAGRRYLRLNAGDEAILVEPCGDEDHVACATVHGHALICEVGEISLLAGPGKGVKLIKLLGNDQLVGAALLRQRSDRLTAEHQSGKRFDVTLRRYGAVSRAGKGQLLFKRGELTAMVEPDPVLEGWAEEGDS